MVRKRIRQREHVYVCATDKIAAFVDSRQVIAHSVYNAIIKNDGGCPQTRTLNAISAINEDL